MFFERVVPPRHLQFVGDKLHAPYREAWLKLFKAWASLRYLQIFEIIMTQDSPDTSDDLGLRFRGLSAEDLL